MAKSNARLNRKETVKQVCIIAAVVLAVFSLSTPGRRFWQYILNVSGFTVATDAPLNIHFIDVGKADAILIECEGHCALLDSGTSVKGDTVSDYLTRCGVDELELAIASHPDKDHIGGMAQVLSEKTVGEFVHSEYNTDSYEDILAVLDSENISERTVTIGEEFRLGGAVFTVLGPISDYNDTNNNSLVLRLDYNGFSALFCGDIETEAEEELLESRAALSVDLLKVAHHGSKSSSSEEFLAAVSPQYAVVSVGRDNNDLPKESVLRRLDAVCEDVLRTDTDGTIIFSYDNSEISIKTEEGVLELYK